MRNVSTVNFPSGNPQPAPIGAGRADGAAKNPSKPPLGTFTNEGQ
jgi:hypothetical protein